MKLRYEGTGSTSIEGVGVVAHGNEIEVPEAVGAALVKERPDDWKRAGKVAKEPTKAGGGGD